MDAIYRSQRIIVKLLKDKIMKKLIVLLVIVTALFSCSKNDDSPSDPAGPVDIKGKYLVLTSTSSLDKYAYIDDDYISLLSEVGFYGTRFRNDLEYTRVSDTELTIYSNSFSISFIGNKLILDGGIAGKYEFITESSAPTANEWVTKINPEVMLQQSSFAMDAIADMAYYGGFVYTDGHRDLGGNYVITKIDPQTGTIQDLAIAPANTTTLGYEDNIEYVGSNEFWVYQRGGANDIMYEFDTSFNNTNTVIMPFLYGNVYHLGSNESELWGSFYSEIRKYDFVAQQWGNKVDLNVQLLDGLDVNNEYLYISGQGIIHKYSLNPFKAVASYDISMDNKYILNGFTLTNGNQIIASAYNYNTTKFEILKNTLP